MNGRLVSLAEEDSEDSFSEESNEAESVSHCSLSQSLREQRRVLLLESLRDTEEKQIKKSKSKDRISSVSVSVSEETSDLSLSEGESGGSTGINCSDKVIRVWGEHRERDEKGNPKYFVQFEGKSFAQCRFVTSEELNLLKSGYHCLKNYQHRKMKRDLVDSDFSSELLVLEDQDLCEQWTIPQRVVDSNSINTKFLVKWFGLDYDMLTWESRDSSIEDLVKAYENRQDKECFWKIISPRYERPPFTSYKAQTFEKSKQGLELRPYQVEGANWLRFCWYNGRNCILGDEMGLGKTAQVIASLNSLYIENSLKSPTLVVAPLSVLDHWLSEFGMWSSLDAVVYHGGANATSAMRHYEFDVGDEKGRLLRDRIGFEVLITNYETLMADYEILKDIEWQFLIVDEAHKLKNINSAIYRKMCGLTIDHAVLLTGTPIQNNMKELFSLLHFVDPRKFASSEEFMSQYGSLKSEEQVREIQALLKPVMLRRKKVDVEKDIPAKEETVIEVELTRAQRSLYKELMYDSRDVLTGKISGSSLGGLMNLAAELTKVCDHPFLVSGAEEALVSQRVSERGISRREAEDQCLVECSGKMILIDKLLQKLRGKHKVIIFSQYTRALDLIHDMLELRGFPAERIDGSVRQNARQAAVDRFNNSPDAFVFLFSTRAGGVGINLNAADTVIIFDSDHNPQNDLQAESRCHRIGQTKTVKVYRLVTRGTYEQELYLRTLKKLALDHVVLDHKGGGKGAAADIESMLRHGVHAIFDEDSAEADSFSREDIDQILEKRARVYTQDVVAGGSSIFAKASFVADEDEEDKSVWLKVLPQKENSNKADVIKKWHHALIRNLQRRGYRGGMGELDCIRQAFEIESAKGSCEDIEIMALQSFLNNVKDESVKVIPDSLVRPASKNILKTVSFDLRVRSAIAKIRDINWPVIVSDRRTRKEDFRSMRNVLISDKIDYRDQQRSSVLIEAVEEVLGFDFTLDIPEEGYLEEEILEAFTPIEKFHEIRDKSDVHRVFFSLISFGDLRIAQFEKNNEICEELEKASKSKDKAAPKLLRRLFDDIEDLKVFSIILDGMRANKEIVSAIEKDMFCGFDFGFQIDGTPHWWLGRANKHFCIGLYRHGFFSVSSIMVDNELCFKRHIAVKAQYEFEHCAKLESEGIFRIPQTADDLSEIFSGSFRRRFLSKLPKILANRRNPTPTASPQKKPKVIQTLAKPIKTTQNRLTDFFAPRRSEFVIETETLRVIALGHLVAGCESSVPLPHGYVSERLVDGRWRRCEVIAKDRFKVDGVEGTSPGDAWQKAGLPGGLSGEAQFGLANTEVLRMLARNVRAVGMKTLQPFI